MTLEAELSAVYYGSEDGCSDPDCAACKVDFDRVLAFVQEKLDTLQTKLLLAEEACAAEASEHRYWRKRTEKYEQGLKKLDAYLARKQEGLQAGPAEVGVAAVRGTIHVLLEED